jgi:UDP:flavonoid glycosyltransferase YjiC (YdhE family)
MIPVIRKLHNDGNQVLLAGSGRSGALLQAAFPGLPFFHLPSNRIRLGHRFPFLQLMLQLPVMAFSVIREHYLTRRLLEKHPADVVISDNRYGMYSRKALSVLVTHQVSPVLPPALQWCEYLLYRFLRCLILHFDACWIPDLADPDNNLSGQLSHRYPLPRNATFTGPLSRFAGLHVPAGHKGTPRLAVVISGPEPQGSHFENLIRGQLTRHPMSAVIAGGLRVPRGSATLPPEVSRTEHPDDSAMAALLTHAGLVVCRSGYSSIMDLAALGVSALLVATPGQTEQEYLAKWVYAKGWCNTVTEQNFDLSAGTQSDLTAKFPEIEEFDSHVLYRKYEEHRQQSEQKS